MTRTLKALGLALLAVCAFGAVATSSASAVDKITCVGASNCDVTAEGSATFGTKHSSISVTCNVEKYSGTVTNATGEEVTVTPTYDNCSSTVDVSNCQYILTGETTSHSNTGVGTVEDARVKVECGHNAGSIKITGFGCTITIEDTHSGTTVNQDLHGVRYDSEGSGSTADIGVTITVDDIKYTASGGLCNVAGVENPTGIDGFLTATTTNGVATAKGYTDNSSHLTSDHVGLALD